MKNKIKNETTEQADTEEEQCEEGGWGWGGVAGDGAGWLHGDGSRELQAFKVSGKAETQDSAAKLAEAPGTARGGQQLLQVLLAPSSCLPCPPPAPPPRTAPTFTANLRGLGFHSSGRLLAGLVGLLGAGRCFVARGRGRPDSNLLPAFVWLLVRVQEEG